MIDKEIMHVLLPIHLYLLFLVYTAVSPFISTLYQHQCKHAKCGSVRRIGYLLFSFRGLLVNKFKLWSTRWRQFVVCSLSKMVTDSVYHPYQESVHILTTESTIQGTSDQLKDLSETHELTFKPFKTLQTNTCSP